MCKNCAFCEKKCTNKIVREYFESISPEEIKTYIQEVHADAFLGDEKESKTQYSTRLSMMYRNIKLIDDLRKSVGIEYEFSNKKKTLKI